MSVPTKYQLSAVKETTYATPVTTTRFFEANNDTIKPNFGRIDSQGLRPNTQALRSDRFVPYKLGADGDLVMEVGSKNFGFWLEHMVGTVASSAAVDGKTTHTGTWGSLLGKSFTLQHGMPFHPADTVQPFTFFGGKVAKWKLESKIDGLLMATLSCDFADFDTTTALATASYPTGIEPFSFVGATVTIGGVAFEATDFAVDEDNALKLDRRYMRAGGAIKKEPVEQAWRVGTWSLSGDFTDMNQLNRVQAAAASGAVAQIVATWTGVGLIGVSSVPTVTVTIPAARFDQGYPTVAGPTPLSQPLQGKVLFDGSASPVSIAYGTADATP